ncbi:MAG TPA: serine/threonine-protein kinase [Nannocystaceae bacterium]|nr:serine/threonine-protein kinase [Nannocystaceae bacterium]
MADRDASLEVTEAGSSDEAATRSVSPRLAQRELPRGTAIGRYVVLERIGAGAMGTVYAAYDPKLDRRIALKLVRPHAGRDANTAQLRLLREAQALARLSHPNVVAVHDAGTHDDVVWVAMEFVDGTTLGTWLEQSRTWREIVETFAAAGRGLAAAHAAGLVHRDFKPDNVMIASREAHADAVQVVRVMDFGLARATIDPSNELTEPITGDDVALTRTGALVGTPAYMAPEVHCHGVVDARSDQFAFCVALYQALYRSKPFVGTTLPELALAVIDGQLREPQRDETPRWLWPIVRRGLQVDAAARWPDMDALVAALQRRRDRGSLWVVGGLALATAGGVAAFAMPQREAEPCTDAPQRMAGVWDEERADATAAALHATGLGYADAEAERVRVRLDEYTRRWTDQYRDACLAHRRGEQSDRALDARMVCLDGRREAVRALVDVLVSADEAVVERATKMASGLPQLDRCADLDAVLDELPPPEDPVTAAAVASVRRQLADARALLEGGRYDAARSLVEGAMVGALATEHAPVIAEARLELGRASERAGIAVVAERELIEAFMAATAVEHDRVAADAAIAVLALLGGDAARAKETEPWIRLATAAVTRIGDAAEDRASLLAALASTRAEQGRFEEAATAAQQALELRQQLDDPLAIAGSLVQLALVDAELGHFDQAREQAGAALELQRRELGEQHPAIARSELVIAGALAQQGRFTAAMEHVERALAIREAVLGRAHVDVAEALRVRSTITARTGDTAAATRDLERVLQILSRVYGDDDQRLTPVLMTLGSVAYLEGDLPRARTQMERALAIRERTLSPDHPDLASTYTNLGAVLQLQGDLVGARARLERALAIRERALGREHPDVALTLGNLAGVVSLQGETAAALALRKRELAIREVTNGPTHFETGVALAGVGELELLLGDVTHGRATLERALPLLEAVPQEQLQTAVTRFRLAQAMWATPSEHAEARALAERARTELATAPHLQAQLAEIDAWLAKPSVPSAAK